MEYEDEHLWLRFWFTTEVIFNDEMMKYELMPFEKQQNGQKFD
jgi:hypothetical protein